MTAGRAGYLHLLLVTDITETRTRTGLSQQQFAELLGVSTGTLQEWEHGRRKSSGAARSLFAITSRVLREFVAK
jgi:putative transcriptional regulator